MEFSNLQIMSSKGLNMKKESTDTKGLNIVSNAFDSLFSNFYQNPSGENLCENDSQNIKIKIPSKNFFNVDNGENVLISFRNGDHKNFTLAELFQNRNNQENTLPETTPNIEGVPLVNDSDIPEITKLWQHMADLVNNGGRINTEKLPEIEEQESNFSIALDNLKNDQSDLFVKDILDEGVEKGYFSSNETSQKIYAAGSPAADMIEDGTESLKSFELPFSYTYLFGNSISRKNITGLSNNNFLKSEDISTEMTEKKEINDANVISFQNSQDEQAISHTDIIYPISDGENFIKETALDEQKKSEAAQLDGIVNDIEKNEILFGDDSETLIYLNKNGLNDNQPAESNKTGEKALSEKEIQMTAKTEVSKGSALFDISEKTLLRTQNNKFATIDRQKENANVVNKKFLSDRSVRNFKEVNIFSEDRPQYTNAKYQISVTPSNENVEKVLNLDIPALNKEEGSITDFDEYTLANDQDDMDGLAQKKMLKEDPFVKLEEEVFNDHKEINNGIALPNDDDSDSKSDGKESTIQNYANSTVEATEIAEGDESISHKIDEMGLPRHLNEKNNLSEKKVNSKDSEGIPAKIEHEIRAETRFSKLEENNSVVFEKQPKEIGTNSKGFEKFSQENNKDNPNSNSFLKLTGGTEIKNSPSETQEIDPESDSNKQVINQNMTIDKKNLLSTEATEKIISVFRRLKEPGGFEDETKTGTVTERSYRTPGDGTKITDEGKDIRAFQQKDVLDQVIKKAILELKGNRSEIKIDIKPDHLGNLKIQVINHQQHVVAKIVAENVHVKEILEQNLSHLKSELTQSGIRMDQIDVSVEQDQTSYHTGQQEDKWKKSGLVQRFGREQFDGRKQENEETQRYKEKTESEVDYYA